MSVTGGAKLPEYQDLKFLSRNFPVCYNLMCNALFDYKYSSFYQFKCPYFLLQIQGADTSRAAQRLNEKEARVEQLTKDWTEKWKEAKAIMQVGNVT